MRIITNIEPRNIGIIREYIEHGRYRSLAEFVDVAIQNQIALEETEATVSPAGAQQFRTAVPGSALEETTAEGSHSPLETTPRISDAKKPLLRKPSQTVKTIPPPEAQKLWSEYVWGQYNRIFPGVLALRVLANLLELNRVETVSLDELYSEAGSEARAIGKVLQQVDRAENRSRGQRLATALPVATKDAVKALTRYRTQFIGHLAKKEGKLYGLCPSLLMVDIMSGAKQGATIGITKYGLEFASLPNPILDEHRFDTTLGPEEVEFYIRHVRSSLPREFGAMKTLAQAIQSGKQSSTSLDTTVRTLDSGWSGQVVATQKAGLLGRMLELGLVEIAWTGPNSAYRCSPEGKRILLDLGSNSSVGEGQLDADKPQLSKRRRS